MANIYFSNTQVKVILDTKSNMTYHIFVSKQMTLSFFISINEHN